ncbi:MAG TPA: Hsp20/alpha crystallin family protein, partial [Gemmatimonadaceae bacterium]|nr:Hsp20/alpha crystallin family protein [Gemmatimonadaceae bacterium]
MLTTRTNPMNRMLTLNRVLDEAFQNSLGAINGSAVWVPAMDIAERADAYLVNLELPGVPQETVELNFEQNVLSIRGTKPWGFDTQKDGELRLHTRERVSGTFERNIRLP